MSRLLQDAFYSSRTAGSVLGAGFQAFISDWDKVTASVNYYELLV
jgi:hypothetical protein